MALTLEQLQNATLDDLRASPDLLRGAVTAYGGFKDGVAQYNAEIGDLWLSGQRDFTSDKQYALRNLAGTDRSNPVTQQFYGDGIFAPKDPSAALAPSVSPLTATSTVAPLGSAERTQQILAQFQSAMKPETFGSSFNAGALGAGTATGPTLPPQTAGTNTIAYANSVAGDLANKRKTVEETYKTQVANLQAQIDKSNKAITDLTSLQQNDVLPNIDAQLKPFRETLEKSERERLKVEENYFANQKLTGELESLLTTLQEQIKAEEAVTGLSSIRSPRIAQIKDEVAGRVGVIEAVMSARSGQIAEAYRLIDRSIDAIAADRQDRLKYYETLFNFYEGQKDTEGKKLLSLEGDKKQFLAGQIALIENDLKTAEATANYIKELMVDPQTALMAAQAGITLNDSIETINAKLSKQLQTEEKSSLINDMAIKGYSYAATPAQLAGKSPDQIFTVRDSRGNELKFIKSSASTANDGTLTDAQKQTTISQIVNQFDGEPIVKEYNVITQGYQFASSLAGKTQRTSTDDQGLIYAFAKAMDPNSVVREGEYATVQKYAQSWAQAFGFKAERIFSNETFLSNEAVQNMIATINAKYQVSEQQYQNVYGEYNRRIEDAKSGQVTGSLTNYGAAFGGTSTGTPSGDSVSFDSWASF